MKQVVIIVSAGLMVGLAFINSLNKKPQQIEVIKYVDRVIEKEGYIESKTTKTKSKITSPDGTITESETEIAESKIDEFLKDKLSVSESTKVKYDVSLSGYGASFGLNEDKKLTLDLDYYRELGEVFNAKVIAKGGVNFTKDLTSPDINFDSVNVGIVLLK